MGWALHLTEQLQHLLQVIGAQLAIISPFERLCWQFPKLCQRRVGNTRDYFPLYEGYLHLLIPKDFLKPAPGDHGG